MSSLAMAPPYKPQLYHLNNNRSFTSPKFKEQREIIKSLVDENIIIILDSMDKNGNSTSVDKAWTFRFKRLDDIEPEPLRDYHSKLLLKLEEANLNHQALTSKTILQLDYDSEYIYVVYEFHKLRINSEPIRPHSNVQLLVEFLMDQPLGAIVTQEEYPYPNSRGFEDVLVKKGFKGSLRKTFLPVLERKKVQLLREVEVPIAVSTTIYNELIINPYNKELYIRYMEGIE